ncbi:tRNA pseudouridine(55) synthase TruB [Blochmannia endosymbiont of Polyrhachis (Hedomyrma) turneri]|uniref:tRNA pseudouridine(55) synthase TruB n=1 Tax=Blochmannia endosymbiont of Polyrhachis (Hedomyrma) turneri TaxID=1505596 RepID=UPI00061AB076|nr:tRNA pseudouridine(55) synthase TruB [Blochmannia endosymbiont of Polyrhachis (Hedomyrma) turneri]
MRDVHGVLFLDKVSGISSASVLRQVKILFQAKKVGHAGTLDPLATGMLPICFGEATKFSRYFLAADKSYKVVAKFGERTDTYDSYGRSICIRPVKLNKESLYQTLSFFIGKSYQVPPMFSALKYCGRPLYQYARHGINIARGSRLINIYNINLLQWDDMYIELEVFCSKGTYIRSFVDDLGEYLGCGAHIVSLRRSSLGHFTSDFMIHVTVLKTYVDNDMSSSDFEKLDSLLYPVDVMVKHFPEVNVSVGVYRLLRCGQKIEISGFGINVTGIKLVRMTVGVNRKFFGMGNIVDNKYLLVDRLSIF